MNLQAYADPAELPASEATRVARLLAIDGPDILSDVQLARRIDAGLLPGAAVALAEVLGRRRVVGSCYPRGNAPASAQGQQEAIQGAERAAV